MLRLEMSSRFAFLEPDRAVVYHTLYIVSWLFLLYKLHRRLRSSGHDQKKLIVFLVLSTLLGVPGAFLGSRAAGMFDHPSSEWSIDLLLENVWSGQTHAFHASIVLPIIILSILTVVMKYRYFEVMDTVFLYLPIAQAVGRVGCLIVGCCWGRSVALDIPGFHGRVENPIPLYAILLSISVFYFLKCLYDKVYLNPDTRNRYQGSIFASYLVSYGVLRVILEVFRTERKILFALTQAQIAMVFFVLIGLAVFAIIGYSNRRSPAPSGIDTGVQDAIDRLYSLLGVVASYLALLFVMYHLSWRLRIVPWPIHRADSVSDAYVRVVNYLPALLLPLVSVYWLRRVRLPILKRFEWERSSRVFYLSLIVSMAPALHFFAVGESRLRGVEYWPPFLMLCAINAFCEETVHRLAVLSLFRSAGFSRLVSITVQALLYTVVHFMVLSPAIGVLSFLYGCLLGVLMDRTGSVTPCIICHFIIDVGVLAPLLSS